MEERKCIRMEKGLKRKGKPVVFVALFLMAVSAFRTEEVTRSISRETVLETVSEGVISKEPAEEDRMKIALTFDDGPHPVYTPRLLDGLKERGVKASFFVVGENAKDNPGLIERMYEEGHLIGNHTYSHVQLTGIPEEEACEELLKTSREVEIITGEHLEYVRPPFGSWNDRLDCDILMIPVLWSVDSRDWTTTNVSEIVQRVVTQARENDIILMHDYYASSVEAALQIVDQLKERGYEFVTADELIVN